MYKDVKEWSLTTDAVFNFDAYSQGLSVTDRIRSEISKEFYTENRNFDKRSFSVTCKQHEGTVNLYQWVWITTNTADKTYHVASPSYLCTYGIN